MLKPSDVKIETGAPAAQLEALEKQADNAIRAATLSGEWPAPVTKMRMPTTNLAVREVRKRYRDAGWIIDDAKGCYFTVDHPDRRGG